MKNAFLLIIWIAMIVSGVLLYAAIFNDDAQLFLAGFAVITIDMLLFLVWTRIDNKSIRA